jgi:hypothetical protein
MPYYLYRDVNDDRVYAYDEPQPDLAVRPGWELEANQGTADALTAIARLEAGRAAAAHEAALIAWATAERLAREAGQPAPTQRYDDDPARPVSTVRLAYPVSVASSNVEEVRVGDADPGTLATWRNEWGALRGTPPTTTYKDDALLRAVPRGDLTSGNNGCAVELQNAARTATVYGRRWRDGALIRNGTAMADVVVLAPGAPVPAGTAEGTVIVRRSA